MHKCPDKAVLEKLVDFGLAESERKGSSKVIFIYIAQMIM